MMKMIQLLILRPTQNQIVHRATSIRIMKYRLVHCRLVIYRNRSIEGDAVVDDQRAAQKVIQHHEVDHRAAREAVQHVHIHAQHHENHDQSK